MASQLKPSSSTSTAQPRKRAEGAQFVRYFGPTLDALRKLGGSGSPDEVVYQIAADLNISDEIQNEALPSGELRYPNQVHWARFYLVREGLIESSKRGVWSLTEAGRATHLSPQEARDIFLKWVKKFQDRRRSKSSTDSPSVNASNEEIENASAVADKDYKADVRETLLALPPTGFERLAQRILRESGFTQVVVTGKTGDGGIDGEGTLQINPLLSFKVLFQCKRLKGSVSSSQVRDFRGAMAGRADKGIIISTGAFTAEARREATRDGVPPIELIDSEKLIEMLEQLELGLKRVTSYELDVGFFKEFS
jgi:restriction system protein